ncbi:MAG: preprotein translocase subunit YajC [Chlamydiota bacterium]
MLKTFLFLIPSAAVFAQESAPTPGGGMTQTFIMIGIALLFFYFILWRPEQKRRKAAEQMRSSLKKGDRVTAMGIIGKVEKIQEQTVILKMVEGKIEVLKAAITDIQASMEEEPRSES